jgi:hypothetical protein
LINNKWNELSLYTLLNQVNDDAVCCSLSKIPSSESFLTIWLISEMSCSYSILGSWIFPTIWCLWVLDLEVCFGFYWIIDNSVVRLPCSLKESVLFLFWNYEGNGRYLLRLENFWYYLVSILQIDESVLFK